MKPDFTQAAAEWGLLANGSSGRWDIAVDEALAGDEWTLEIDGPEVYLSFLLDDLSVLSKARHFLQAYPRANSVPGQHPKLEANVLQLGRFGSCPVSLVWDNEDFPRCFLLIPDARSTLRLSFSAQDIQMLGEALQQIVKDLPEATDE